MKSVKLPDSKKKREVHSASSYARSIVEASLDPFATIGAEEKITPLYKTPDDATGYARLQIINRNFSDYFNEPRISKLI